MLPPRTASNASILETLSGWLYHSGTDKTLFTSHSPDGKKLHDVIIPPDVKLWKLPHYRYLDSVWPMHEVGCQISSKYALVSLYSPNDLHGLKQSKLQFESVDEDPHLYGVVRALADVSVFEVMMKEGGTTTRDFLQTIPPSYLTEIADIEDASTAIHAIPYFRYSPVAGIAYYKGGATTNAGTSFEMKGFGHYKRILNGGLIFEILYYGTEGMSTVYNGTPVAGDSGAPTMSWSKRKLHSFLKGKFGKYYMFTPVDIALKQVQNIVSKTN